MGQADEAGEDLGAEDEMSPCDGRSKDFNPVLGCLSRD